MTLTEFLLARIAEDEVAARAVPPLDHNFDMGGNRQDERWLFDRSLPSSADGMGNWSKHRNSPTTTAHFARHDPARVLAECEAKRRIVELATFSDSDRSAVDFWLEPEQRDLTPPGFTAAMISVLQALAAVDADHPDYRQEWRP